MFKSNFINLQSRQRGFIYTDPSGDGLGAILKQPQENGILHPVAYFSKKLNSNQRKNNIFRMFGNQISHCILATSVNWKRFHSHYRS